MGFLDRLSTTVRPGRRALGGPEDDRWYVPAPWMGALSAAGVPVSPELAMTLSAVYCAVTMIADDISTLPCQFFKYREDEGKERIRSGRNALGTGGIGGLVYRLRWQPNEAQTAVEFWRTMIGQLLLREFGFAEILPGPSGFADQLIPRHPDRVTPERLPSGRLRYRLLEGNGTHRYLTQDEAFVIRGLSPDGVTLTSRITYGMQSFGTALATEKATATFFKNGFTAAMLAHYTGDKDETEEQQLHESISRYASGVDNAFGLLLLNDEIKIEKLGIEPEKAQMMGAREFGVREVARWFKIPGHKLEAAMQTQAYAAREQANLEYVVGCLRPIIINVEQAIQRDLVLAKDTYFPEFLIEALLRGDMKARADYYERAIRSRWMRPSEVRLRENMNPDADLDRLSEQDHRAGGSGGGEGRRDRDDRDAKHIGSGRRAGAHLRASLLVFDSAQRVLRRERASVEKIAKRHANDVDGWKAELSAFYIEHASFISNTMRLPATIARAYANQHRAELEAQGVVWMQNDLWEREEAEELSTLTLEEKVA